MLPEDSAARKLDDASAASKLQQGRYEHVHSIANIAADGADPLPKSMEDSEWDMSNDEGDTDKPWLAEFNRYLTTHDVLPEGITIVKWWGVCNVFFLLACTNSESFL